MTTQVVSLELDQASKRGLAELRRRTTPAQFQTHLLRFFELESSRVAGSISQNFLAGKRLKIRTGTLAKSVVGRSARVKGSVGMRVGILDGPALRYAGPQEYGTKGFNPSSPYPTIKPTRAKALAIPINSALTKAGVAKYVSPRDYPGGLFFIAAHRGKVIGFLFPKGKKGGPKRQRGGGIAGLGAPPAYLLVRSVDLKPKWYLRDGFRAELPNTSLRLGEAIKRLIVAKT